MKRFKFDSGVPWWFIAIICIQIVIVVLGIYVGYHFIAKWW